MRRVVVTGLGLLTPLGLGVDINWKRLTSGNVGINQIKNWFNDEEIALYTRIQELSLSDK